MTCNYIIIVVAQAGRVLCYTGEVYRFMGRRFKYGYQTSLLYLELSAEIFIKFNCRRKYRGYLLTYTRANNVSSD